MYAQLTSSELTKSLEAVGYITDHSEMLQLDKLVATKLSTLHADLTAEAEDRQAIALPQREPCHN